jgi:hypothetical protein
MRVQLKVQPKLGLGRSSTSLLNLLKPKKRKRSAVDINNNKSPSRASVELRRAHNAPQQHVRCLFKYTKT